MSLALATYNVLDFFDDDESHIAQKISTIAKSVEALAADVIGFQEIASDAAFDRLIRAAGITNATVVHGTRDARGIGSSLVSRLPILESAVLTIDTLPFPVFVDGDPEPFGARIPLRRGFVSALIDAGDWGRVRVFVAHLKSGRGVMRKTNSGESIEPSASADFAEMEIRATVWRAAEALFLRRAIDAAMADERVDHVAVLGDLNDVSGSLALRILSGVGDDELRSMGASICPERRFSTIHRGRPEAIDHILVSRTLADHLVEARFDNEKIRDLSTLSADDPRPHDSDHAALVARFSR